VNRSSEFAIRPPTMPVSGKARMFTADFRKTRKVQDTEAVLAGAGLPAIFLPTSGPCVATGTWAKAFPAPAPLYQAGKIQDGRAANWRTHAGHVGVALAPCPSSFRDRRRRFVRGLASAGNRSGRLRPDANCGEHARTARSPESKLNNAPTCRTHFRFGSTVVRNTKVLRRGSPPNRLGPRHPTAKAASPAALLESNVRSRVAGPGAGR
jgi:hypothetical protein